MSWNPVPFGASPWHQSSWDLRAAGNFVFGGAGSGLVVAAALSPAWGGVLPALLVAGVALVGLGLFCVFLELGRPLRAINVIRNPRTSWMSREAIASALLVAAVAAVVAGVSDARWAAAAFALAFLYCQARLLNASRGVPAWRDAAVVPLVVSTGLAEGFGLFWLAAPVHRAGSLALLGAFGVLLIVRWLVFRAYRFRVDAALAPGARQALDRVATVMHYGGTWVPLALAALAVVAGEGAAPALAALAGLAAALCGAYAKRTLLVRAGYNQGFALPHLPVRGVRS